MFRKYFTGAAAVAIATLQLFTSPPSHAAAPEIWFAPLDQLYHPGLGYNGSVDYQNLFTPDSDWRHASSLVSVFKLGPRYVRAASDDELRNAIAWLKQHHIGLAIELGLLPHISSCPPLEGQDTDQLTIARRLKSLGADVAYFDADGPLLSGLEGSPNPACNQPIAVIAKQAAANARAFRSVFPKAKFTDIEAVTNFKDSNPAKLISAWHAAFASSFGEPFAAFHFDINWHNPNWQGRVHSVYNQMRQDHMPVGVICDGSSEDRTDAAWLAEAERHCELFVKVVGSQPDAFILESWFVHPTHVLPESDPNSFTHLILNFAAHPPR